MSDWTFEQFGGEFDTHVAAHLPGYADVQRLVSLIAAFTVPVGGKVADLGCSTGASAATISVMGRGVKFHLYDLDTSMIEAAQARLNGVDATFHVGDITDGLAHRDADLTLALWVLQFISPAAWRRVLAAARSRSTPRGAILVAAKTQHADPRWEEIAVAALDDYKAQAGVSAEERAAKTASLRGVMTAAPAAAIAAELTAAGWHSPTVLWRWHVWSIIGAYASPVLTGPM